MGSEAAEELSFAGKTILAPMVRIGTLPMRLLALDYGADLVFCEEIVDLSILKAKRLVNHSIGEGCVDFCVDKEKYPVFRTCAKERSKVVFQMGTCTPEKAVDVVRLVENDCAAIDVNMGCPKAFSIQGGMGAALLQKPLLIKEILTAMVSSTTKPVTCKIRVLPSMDDTLELCRIIERCNVKALTVHGRTRDERPRHPNRNDTIRQISGALSIPVIANGGSSQIQKFEDIAKFKEDTSCSSVMLARAAMLNPSIFRPDGKLPLDDVICDYIRHSIAFDNCPQNSKYTIQQMLQELQTNTDRGRDLLKAPALRDICKVWGMENDWLDQQKRMRDRSFRHLQHHGSSLSDRNGTEEISPHQVAADVTFIRSYFGPDTPKSFLNQMCLKQKMPQPKYETVQRPTDKKFQCTMTVPGLSEKSFLSTYWEKNMRSAEQASCIVALHYLKFLSFLPTEYQSIDYR